MLGTPLLFTCSDMTRKDTTAERWKDGNGAGIVPEDMPERPVQPRGSFESLLSEDESSVGSDAAMHYAGNPKGRSRLSKVFYQYFTSKRNLFNIQPMQ